jgi:hypothetical protein
MSKLKIQIIFGLLLVIALAATLLPGSLPSSEMAGATDKPLTTLALASEVTGLEGIFDFSTQGYTWAG